MPETDKERADRLEAEARERGTGGRSGPTDEGRGVAEKLLRKYRGRATEALAHMADEAKDLREDRRTLREELKTLKAPGTVILSADDAKEYEGFKALGKKAADVKKDLEKVAALETKVTEHDRRTAADEAAPLVGFNPATLRELIADKKLEISFRDEVKDGKTVKVPLVKAAGADDKTAPVPLADYAKTNLSAYLPALTAKPAAGTTTGTPAAPAKPGTQMVEQSSGSSTAQNGDPKPRAPSTAKYVTPGQRAAATTNNPVT